MNYFFIAGEQSGDLHGADLIKSIQTLESKSNCFAYGSHQMQKAGARLLSDFRNTQFMGIWDVLINLPKIIRKLENCKQDILESKPDVVILIDNPSFNIRIASFCKSKGIKTVWYISPKIWAWNYSRIYKLKKVIDHMLVIFPFERQLYKREQIPCTYVGNPTANQVDDFLQFVNPTKQMTRITKIALLPGSRPKEIERIIPIFKKLILNCPNWQFLVACASTVKKDYYLPIIDISNVEIYFDQTFQTLSKCDLAVVTSGTSTLEAAILNIPQIIVYKTDWITYWVARFVLKTKWIGLPNILLNRQLVKELIQFFTAEEIKVELLTMTESQKKRDIENGYFEVKQILGEKKAAENAALQIIQLCSL
jgi:lipid-A-disaccharide synthase